MEKAMRALTRFTEHPATELMTGFMLLLTSLADIFDQLFTSVLGIDLGVEHGVVVLGVLHILKAIPKVFASVVELTAANMQEKASRVAASSKIGRGE